MRSDHKVKFDTSLDKHQTTTYLWCLTHDRPWRRKTESLSQDRSGTVWVIRGTNRHNQVLFNLRSSHQLDPSATNRQKFIKKVWWVSRTWLTSTSRIDGSVVIGCMSGLPCFPSSILTVVALWNLIRTKETQIGTEKDSRTVRLRKTSMGKEEVREEQKMEFSRGRSNTPG